MLRSNVLSDASAHFPADAEASAQGVRRVWDRAGKRLLDLFLSVALIIMVTPLIAILALAIKLDSRGPVFYRCRRVGFRGRPLEMLKLRKMTDGAIGPALTTANDARLTRCGRFLAATKLDELPQLWHVLTGEMSLVGPRPEEPDFVALHPREYKEIFAVKPGMTGLCQLAFAREGAILDPEDRVANYISRLLPAKVQVDLLYTRRRSIVMDLSILGWTTVAVLLRQGVAVHRDSGRLSLRRRRRAPFLAAETGEHQC